MLSLFDDIAYSYAKSLSVKDIDRFKATSTRKFKNGEMSKETYTSLIKFYNKLRKEKLMKNKTRRRR